MRIARDVRRFIQFGFWIWLALSACAAAARADAKPPHGWRAATLEITGQQIRVTVPSEPESARVVPVVDPEVQWECRALGPRHEIQVEVSTVDGRRQVTAVGNPWTSTSRALAILGSLAFWLLVAAVLLGGKPWELVVGADNRYSNSKLQMALWFGVVLTSYTAILLLRAIASRGRLIGGVEIPQNLLLLSGLSALTFAGAKAITQGKVDDAKAAGVIVKDSKGDPRFPRDLFMNDNNQADIGDFQMLLVTLLAISVYTMLLVNFLEVTPMSPSLTLPDVDQTILAVFGLGQGAYLAKKFVSRPGEG